MNKQLKLVSSYLKFAGSGEMSCRFISALVRSSAELEESVADEIKNNIIKARKHPGVMSHSPVSLPDEIQKSILKLLSKGAPYKQLVKESKPLGNYLKSRKAPYEKKEYFQKRLEIRKEVIYSMGIDVEKLPHQEQENCNKMIESKVDNLLKKKMYSWNKLDFTKYMSQLYVVTRGAAEYSVLHKIFKEIYTRSNFVPKTVFDFGSGMGSVIWAANSIWGNSIKEYYCVDSSSQMNNVSEMIIKEGLRELNKKIFYRQFLPSSHDISSDIVVSSYTLLELLSAEQRLEIVRNLWNRTGKYLVLIELGNLDGFKVLNEAREYLLSNINKNDCSRDTSHIFAPCPHNLPCPRAEKKCYFESSYFCFPQRPITLRKELYSYFVFKKGERYKEDKQWPRIVQPVLNRSRHAICRLCCKSGDLKEVIATPAKHGQLGYRCAKASRWGDLFPYNIKPYREVVEDGTDVQVE